MYVQRRAGHSMTVVRTLRLLPWEFSLGSTSKPWSPNLDSRQGRQKEWSHGVVTGCVITCLHKEQVISRSAFSASVTRLLAALTLDRSPVFWLGGCGLAHPHMRSPLRSLNKVPVWLARHLVHLSFGLAELLDDLAPGDDVTVGQRDVRGRVGLERLQRPL